MKNELLQIRISALDKQKLQELAEKNSMSMSEYVVFLIRHESEKNKEK